MIVFSFVSTKTVKYTVNSVKYDFYTAKKFLTWVIEFDILLMHSSIAQRQSIRLLTEGS